MYWGLVSLLRAVSCSSNGITMTSHEDLAPQGFLCSSLDRVTDTVWFNNRVNVGYTTSVSQSQSHTTSSSTLQVTKEVYFDSQ